MNLLRICDHFYPDRAGGSEIVIYETCRRLAKGHRASVVTLKSGEGLGADEEIEGVKVHRYSIKDLSRAAYALKIFTIPMLFFRSLLTRSVSLAFIHTCAEVCCTPGKIKVK